MPHARYDDDARHGTYSIDREAVTGMALNEPALYALAEVAITLAGFSGVVVAFRLRGAQTWSRTELRVLWFLLTDSFLVMIFSLIPVPLNLAGWSEAAIWGLGAPSLGRISSPAMCWPYGVSCAIATRGNS